jgi:E3 ubiquitin-protein ligase RFWD2
MHFEDQVGIHLRIIDWLLNFSNVSWNPYIKNMLASSDYDGAVQLWDTEACKNTRTFNEHEKRCWTVQFNNVDPHLMASGSDDAKVGLFLS